MRPTPVIKKILDNFDIENVGVLNNLAQILMSGSLKGTGNLLGFDVSAGLEDGPAVSYAGYTNCYDPLYLFSLASEAEVSYIAAPIGMVETAAKKYIANTPIILMLNNTNSLNTDKLGPTKAITASVDDALRLGCAGIGFSIHPGSDRAFEMIEDFREIAAEAKSKGLVVALWITPKGGFISRDGESAIDTSAYAAHMASALGAHIINLKTPNKHIEQPKTKKLYKEAGIESQELTGRVRHIVNAAFAGRKIINFCDNFKTEDNILLKDAQEIKQGGANGLCLSYNLFQREKAQAIILSEKITKIFN